MSSVLNKDQAEDLAVSYMPRKFPQSISASAKEFVSLQRSAQQSGHKAGGTTKEFRIDRLNAEQTGVAELERVSIEEQVEKLALERVKQIQEEAYREAYQLGLEEGRETAFTEYKTTFDERLEHMGTLLKTIENLKTELVASNEAHIMKLLYYMASRVAMDEIKSNPDAVVGVMRQAIEGAQSDEKITAKVSKADFTFLKTLQEKAGRDFEFLQRIKLEESDAITTGGCIIETNYGSVDATIEQRVAKLWDSIADKLPKSNDVAG